jgi:hypothetical protein
MLTRISLLLVSFVLIPHLVSAQKAFRLINKGKYDKAQQLSLEQIRESKQFDAANPNASYTYHQLTKRIAQYHSLATVKRLKGDLASAEINYLRADSAYVAFLEYFNTKKKTNWRDFVIHNTVFGEGIKSRQDSKRYERKMDVAGIYIRLGEMDTAKNILDATLREMTSFYGRKTSMAKSVFSTYGVYFMETGNYDSSVFYYRKYIRALYDDPSYFDRSFKRLSDAYAGLAEAHLGGGEIHEALRVAKKARKFATHRFVKVSDGKNYLGKIRTANLLAESYRRNHRYQKALRWNDKAFNVFNKRIKVVTPEKLPVLATRGQIFWAKGDTLASNASFGEMMDVFFGYTQHNFSFLPESERQYFYRNNKNFLELAKAYYYDLYFTKGYQESYLAKRLYEIHINNKGVLLNSASKLLNVLFAKGDPTMLQQYTKLKELKEEKTRALQTGQLSQAATLESEIGRIEKQLRQVLSIEPEEYVSAGQIIRAIPESTHLVDILKCKVFTSGQPESSQGVMLMDGGESKYVYFLLEKNSAMKLLRSDHDESNLEKRFYKGYLNFARLNIQKAEVYEAYFGPLSTHLIHRNIIISTDGIYNLINPEILFDGKQYLADRFDFQSVVSAKDILRLRKMEQEITDITLVGWPDYSTHLKRYAHSPAELPGTETEISEIRKILPPSVSTQIFMRNDANEMVVKDIESTSVLHFATHGFFEASQSKEPMYTSGLVLALSDSLRKDEDGFLTAYEASNLELNRTFLVVLSACETGQGEFEDGEGVWGLQRAFQVAGVRYIVMSLFKVNDEVTAGLMQAFYRNMVKGDDVLSSFRKAQKEIKAAYPRPVEWGAFVIKGF